MARDSFNSVSPPPSATNSIAPPKFVSGFKQDKRGRVIKTEEYFAVGSFIAGDGRRVPVRNGKPLAPLYEAAKKDQDERKAAPTPGEGLQHHAKPEPGRKARSFQF